MSLSDEEFWKGAKKLVRKIEEDVDGYDKFVDLRSYADVGAELEEIIENHETFEHEEFFNEVLCEIRERRGNENFLQKWCNRV